MNSRRMLGGILYWGIDELPQVWHRGLLAVTDRVIVRCQRGRLIAYIQRENTRFRVVNYAHRYFAAGLTTAGGLGFSMAIKNTLKRGSAGGDTHTSFTGLTVTAGAWWIKAYLCIYFNGDGLG